MPRQRETLVGLRRGIELLEHLAAAPQGLSFNELQSCFEELAPSTLSRLLKALQEEGLVENIAPQRSYVLGERAKALGQKLSSRQSRATAWPPAPA